MSTVFGELEGNWETKILRKKKRKVERKNIYCISGKTHEPQGRRGKRERKNERKKDRSKKVINEESKKQKDVKKGRGKNRQRIKIK